MSDNTKSEGERYLEYLRSLELDSAEYRLEAEALGYLLSLYPRADFEEALARDRLRSRSAPQRKRSHDRQQAFNEVYIRQVREAGNDDAITWSLFEYVAEAEKKAKSGDASFPLELKPYRLWIHDCDTDTMHPGILSRTEFHRLLKNARESKRVKKMLAGDL